MNTNLKRALWGTLLAGGITLFGATVAQAAETTGDDGLLSGTQGLISVAVPVTVAGNGISVLGDATSTDAQTSTPSISVGGGDASTSGSDGAGSGTQALIDVVLPVTLGGNAVSVLGDAESTDAATSQPAEAPAAAPAAPEAPAPTTSGSDSILGGTQGVVNVAAPVTVGGNAISVLGDADSTKATTTAPAGTGNGSTGGATTDGTDGILGGTQVLAPITAPITAGGNAISVLGDADSTKATTTAPAGTGNGSTGGATTDGTDGILGGTQVLAPITAPITAGGNAISVLGDADSTKATTTAPTRTSGTTTGGSTTSGLDGILGGTQLGLPITAPITLGGNAVAVVGDATTTGPTTGTPGNPGNPGNPGTPGNPGNPGNPGTPTTGGTPITGMVAASGPVKTLAVTGGVLDMLPLVGGLLALALGVMLTARRRSRTE